MSKFNLTEAPAAAPAFAVIANMEAAPATARRKLDTVAAVREDGTENKTARLELLLRPSTKEGLKAAAKAEGRTVNDLVNRVLEAYLKGN